MKRFLVSLSSLFISTSFAVGLARQTQIQTNKLATNQSRFDDIFLKDEQQLVKSIDSVASMFDPI